MKFRSFNTRHIDAEGFQAGTQGVPPAAQLSEIAAFFAQLKERVVQEAADRIRRLEARIDTLARRLNDAEGRWSDLQMITDGMAPAAVLPICAVSVAMLVVLGEATFLAPVMDAFGIADPMAQILLAGVIVVVTSGLVEIAKRQLVSHTRQVKHDDAADKELAPGRIGFAGYLKAALLCFLTLVSLTLVFFLGWWRAEQMIFAASLQHAGAWKQFMASNPGLTRAVVVLLTTGLPVFVALVFEWGLDGVRLAWEWRKARYQCHRFSKLLNAAKKKLEARREKHESRLTELDNMREEWNSSYEHHHAMGQQIGARKTQLWRVILKIGAVILVIAACCLFLDPYVSSYIGSPSGRLLIYALATLGLGGLYAAYALRAWDRPSARQLFKQRATIWRSVSATSTNVKPDHANGESVRAIDIKTEHGNGQRPLLPVWDTPAEGRGGTGSLG